MMSHHIQSGTTLTSGQVQLEGVSLRPAGAADQDFLRFVYAESRRAELDQVAWPDGAREAFLRSQFDAQAAHYVKYYPRTEFLIIELDNRPVGRLPVGRLYVERGSREIRIMDIAINGEFRGRGLGTALIQQLLDEGRDSAKIVTIHVEKFNPALRLYERLGFRIADDRGAYWYMEWSAVVPAAVS